MSGRGMDPRFMQELKQKNNIVEVIGSYIALDRKGGNYWACCPFHHEKTPSFAVNESEQFYHCFGCGVSGDVVRSNRPIFRVRCVFSRQGRKSPFPRATSIRKKPRRSNASGTRS